MYRAKLSFTTKDYDVKQKEILPEDFASQDEIQEYLELEYIEEYDGTIEITENGIYNVKDYDNADVDVAGGGANLQFKSETIYHSGPTLISPDSGYDGMSEIEVFVDIPEPSGTRSITENGTYDVTSYANVSVNVQSGGDPFATDYAYTKSILSNWDSTETSMQSMFSSDANLKYMPVVDTSNVTTVSSAFTSCSNLIYIPKLNFAEATLMNNTFYGCSKLIYVGDLNTPKVTNTSTMFYGCSSLIEAPMMDLSEVTSLQTMFRDCTNLVKIPLYNTVKAKTSFNNFVTNCPNLSNESLNNILAMCTMSAVTSSTAKTLKKVGLSSTQATTCQTLSNWNAFATAGWTTGY